MKNKELFRHALLMVKKNKRAYIMLSVTIIMSFTFFLSFLIYTDSKIMTDNAATIEQTPYMFETYITGMDTASIYTYITNLSKLDKTKYYISDCIIVENEMREKFSSIISVPSNSWGVFLRMNYEVVKDDNSGISLKNNQALVRTDIYEQLKKENAGNKICLNIPIVLNNGNIKYVELEVIGGYKAKNTLENITLNSDIIVAQDAVKDIDYAVNESRMYIYSHYPKKVQEISDTLALNTKSVYKDKKEIYPQIQKDLKNKGMIAIILFILLGINLYSSFKNALNERKFEIGVKRALGASSIDVIIQFLYEGMIVVTTNIIISSILSVIMFIGYKCYMMFIKGTSFIFYLSKHSICMYLVVSIFLSLVFSLLFAIQSARVEIIKYLKSE